MGFFDFGLRKAVKEQVIVEGSTPVGDAVGGFALSIQTDLPTIKETNKDYVELGVDNQYPQYLKDLFNTSPTHQAIVKTKAQMLVGEGYVSETGHLDEKSLTEVNQILKSINNSIYDIALDIQIYGACALETIWSLDYKRVAKVNRVDPSTIRSGKFNHGYVENYYYSRDWADRRSVITPLVSFDESEGSNYNQLLYVPFQQVSNEYYGEPSYLASTDWISLESSTGLYYKSLFENGFNPSIVVKFYRKPASSEERDTIVRGLKKSFAGVKNSGKAMVMFSDGKDLAPDIEPIASQNVDRQFTVIASQITEKILTGHRVTSPEMFGLAIPGGLGSSDFATKIQIFNKTVIQPEQRILELAINRIFNASGYEINFKLNPFKIE